MLCASLVLILASLDGSSATDPVELVARLGSPRYSVRESAEAELEKLGRIALPTLRNARNSKDLEIQTRANGLIARIEGSLLVQASTVLLDFQDVPIEQVIQTINARSGLSLVLNPEDLVALQGRRLTLKSAEPVPFWKAIDAICEAGQLHFILGAQVPLGQRDGTFLLYDKLAPNQEPTSDSGPFRVALSSVHYQSEIQLSQRAQPFGGARAQPFGDRIRQPLRVDPSLPLVNPDHSRQFFLNLLVTSEPRLAISQNGLPKVTVAVDDKGQSLLVPPSAGNFQHMAGYNGLSTSPMVRLRVDLARPDEAGQKIRLIRGTIPVTVATRKTDPLEIPIAGSAGKVFRNDEVSLTVQLKDSLRANHATALVEVSITQLGPVPRPIQLGEGEPLGYRPDTPQQQIEILDTDGNTLTWFPSGTFYNGEETRLALTIVNRDKPPVPAKIRYYSLIRASADVPFEFRNLPMP